MKQIKTFSYSRNNKSCSFHTINNSHYRKIRSSRLEEFCKKSVLRNFAKFTGKHLCQSLIFNKVAGLRPGTLLKKRLWHSCFLVNFAKFLGAPFFTEHLRGLVLKSSLQWSPLFNTTIKNPVVAEDIPQKILLYSYNVSLPKILRAGRSTKKC